MTLELLPVQQDHLEPGVVGSQLCLHSLVLVLQVLHTSQVPAKVGSPQQQLLLSGRGGGVEGWRGGGVEGWRGGGCQ